MNCKPGDLAVVIHPAAHGKLVEVLRAAPAKQFKLPNGVMHMACPPGMWVIRALGAPFDTFRRDGSPLGRNEFGVGSDRFLRPIRDSDGADETLAWAPKPETVEA